ncbi:MAG: Uncharacterized protein G01um101413_62 [Parcubacteria group bacterium Gr01-1014_13]|nr:MAG: Uncharacterized protein G01um101413_62 [Parcubacteria group bacterium Gr01-1014_13]
MLVILDKLNFYLYKFWIFLKPRRKLGLVSFVILSSLVLAAWFSGVNVAHAGSFWNDIVEGLISIIFAVAGLFIKLTFFVLKFVIEVASYNAFIDSSAVIVGWVMVRDVTNMFFVVVLLLISFGTILGLEQYEYKKLLVKLIMAAIIVNFSRIICGIIIDVAQVVMITFVNGIAATASGNMVNMFGVGEIFKLGNGSSSKVGTTGEQFLAAVAAVTFAAIMMMTMLTFLFLLMARMMTLWILIVLSPFAFVLNVLPQTQKYAGQWWSEFGGNVVAGPIIAFFLWLSFVTVGSGNANSEIEAGSPDKLRLSSGPTTEQETSTGLTSIMSWANMANFAIAIGMLLTGAKIAQQLGAAGGAMMSKAGEFGKKVAMTASGITAARWAGKQAWRGAKGAGKLGLKGVDMGLSKVAGVGTADWKRRGRAIKAWASYTTNEKGWLGLPSRKAKLAAAGKRIDTLYGTPNKVDLSKLKDEETLNLIAQRDAALATARNEKLEEGERTKALEASDDLRKQLEEKGYGVGENEEGETELKQKETSLRKRAWARLGLFYAPQAFKEEYTADQEARAKYTEEQLEHIVSTSKTPMGKEKTRAEAELLRLKSTGQDIKARKIQDVLEKLTDTEKAVMKEKENGKSWDDIKKMGYSEMDISHAKRADNSIKSAAQADQIEKKLSSERELKKLEAIRELLSTQQGELRGKSALSIDAMKEQVNFDITQEKERKLASARDEVLMEQHRFSEANNLQGVLAKQAKDRTEKQSVGNDYPRSLIRSATSLEQKRRDEEELAAALASKDAKAIEIAEEKLKQSIRSLSEMQIATWEQHGAIGGGNMAELVGKIDPELLKNISIDPDDAGSIRKVQAAIFSTLLGEKVEADGGKIAKAVEKFNEVHGEKAEALLEQLRLALDKGAGQGVFSVGGILQAKLDSRGNIRTGVTNAESEEGVRYIKSRRTAARSAAKITTISAGLEGVVDTSSEGRPEVRSNEAQESLAALLGSLTTNILNNVDEYVKQGLASILTNSADVGLKGLKDKLMVEGAARDKAAIASLLRESLTKAQKQEAEAAAKAGRAVAKVANEVFIEKWIEEFGKKK